MKLISTLLLLLIVLISADSHAQKRYRTPPPEPQELITQEQADQIERNHTCVYESRYSLCERRRLYPFRKADSIVLVSFDKNQVRESPFDNHLQPKIPVATKRLNKDKVDELVTLTPQGVDSLTDILYNWTFLGEVNIMTSNQCFIPRNAILFFRKGKVTDYINICFQCENMETTNDKILTGTDCTEHMDMIKQFFIDHGIRVGTLIWQGKETAVPEVQEEEEINEEEQADGKL